MAEASRPDDGKISLAGSAPPPPRTHFGSCPFLGISDDRATHAMFATPRHRCHAQKRPQMIEPGHQGTYCLGAFERCPIYASAKPQAAAVQPLAKPGPPVPSQVTTPRAKPPAGAIESAPAVRRAPIPVPSQRDATQSAAPPTTVGSMPTAVPERAPAPPVPQTAPSAQSVTAPAAPISERQSLVAAPPAAPRSGAPDALSARAQPHQSAFSIPQLVRRWLWLALFVALGSGILADVLGRASVHSSALPTLVVAVTLAAAILVLIIIFVTSLLQPNK